MKIFDWLAVAGLVILVGGIGYLVVMLAAPYARDLLASPTPTAETGRVLGVPKPLIDNPQECVEIASQVAGPTYPGYVRSALLALKDMRLDTYEERKAEHYQFEWAYTPDGELQYWVGVKDLGTFKFSIQCFTLEYVLFDTVEVELE